MTLIKDEVTRKLPLSVFRMKICVQLDDKKTEVNIHSRNTLLNTNNNGQKFNLFC